MSFRNFWGVEVPTGPKGKEVVVEDADRLNVSQVRARAVRRAGWALCALCGDARVASRHEGAHSAAGPLQVALGTTAKDGERVTVFVTNEQGAKYALGSLTKVRRDAGAPPPGGLVESSADSPATLHARTPGTDAHTRRRPALHTCMHVSPVTSNARQLAAQRYMMHQPPPAFCPLSYATRTQGTCDQFSIGKGLAFAMGSQARSCAARIVEGHTRQASCERLNLT